ncbi:MAG: hypothetical protein V3W31_09965 [Thermodesulfobacteriota bacterium]
MRILKLILLPLALVALLGACSNEEPKGASTKEVVDNYVDTLVTAPKKAQKVVDKTVDRLKEQEKLQKEMFEEMNR